MALGREQVATKIVMDCNVASWLHWQQRNLIGPFKSDRQKVSAITFWFYFEGVLFSLFGRYQMWRNTNQCKYYNLTNGSQVHGNEEAITNKKNTLTCGLAGLKTNTQTSRWVAAREDGQTDRQNNNLTNHFVNRWMRRWRWSVEMMHQWIGVNRREEADWPTNWKMDGADQDEVAH